MVAKLQMSTYTKKVKKVYFESILAGKKSFELRLGDFEIKEGDTLILEEEDENGKLSGRKVERIVKYIGTVDLKNTHWPTEEIIEKGLKIISI